MNQIILEHFQEISIIDKIKDKTLFSHIKDILASKKGDNLKVCYPNVGIGIACIIDIGLTTITLKNIDMKKPTQKKIELILGLCRPASLKKILEWGASLGVTNFRIFSAQLTDPSYWNSTIFLYKNHKDIILKGLAQTPGLYLRPKVSCYQNIYQSLTHLEKSHPSNQKFLLSLLPQALFLNKYEVNLSNNDESIYLLLGPERGFTPQEEQKFISMQYRPIKLSSKILRSELAMVTALGHLEPYYA